MKKQRETLQNLSERVFAKLKQEGIQFALAGGMLASLYREEPRATGDIDVLVSIKSEDVLRAKKLVEELGFQANEITEAQLKGDSRFKKASPAQIIVGRNSEDKQAFGVDLLLLDLPWAEQALSRAQSHLIDFGLTAKVPSLTVEDFLIAKLFAIKNSSKRITHKSDLQDIVLVFEQHGNALEINYLSDVMTSLELILPQVVEKNPETQHLLKRVSRKFRRKHKYTISY